VFTSRQLNAHMATACANEREKHGLLSFHAASLLVLMAMFCLFNFSAHAQSSEPIFSYETPSDEMDFDLPATPDLKNVAPPPPPEDPLAQVDRFFSDAPTFNTQDVPATEPGADDAAKEPVEEKETPKKVVRRIPPPPPFNFKSVHLPETIYRKHYTIANRHLPIARTTNDMERGVIGASLRGDIAALRALKNMGTPMDVIAENGEPVLVVAARASDLNTVHWLLVQGVNVNAASEEGLTALHYAAFRGSPAMTELLLSYGANANVTDNRGLTPLMYATRSNAPDVAQTLLKFGADAQARAGNGDPSRLAALSDALQPIQ